MPFTYIFSAYVDIFLPIYNTGRIPRSRIPGLRKGIRDCNNRISFHNFNTNCQSLWAIIRCENTVEKFSTLSRLHGRYRRRTTDDRLQTDFRRRKANVSTNVRLKLEETEWGKRSHNEDESGNSGWCVFTTDLVPAHSRLTGEMAVKHVLLLLLL